MKNKVDLPVQRAGIFFEKGFKTAFLKDIGWENKEHIPEKDWEKVYYTLGKIAYNFTRPAYGDILFHNGEQIFNEGNYPKGNYRNADLIIDYLSSRKGKRILRVYELTLIRSGIVFEENAVNPLPDLGMFVNITLPLAEYFRKVLNGVKNVNFNRFARAEVLKLLQAGAYAIDYLFQTRRPITKLEIFVLTPFKEGLVLNFKTDYLFKNPQAFEKLKELHTRIVELLKNTNDIDFEKRGEIRINRRRILKPLYSITQVREKVRRIVEEHSEKGEVVMLLHTPSSGKTTSVINFAGKRKKALFIYLSSRVKLIDEVAKKLEAKGFKIQRSAKSKRQQKKFHYLSAGMKEEKGNLKSIWEEFVSSEITEREAILSTIHSLVLTKMSNTVYNLVRIIKSYLSKFPDGDIVIGVDEILGASQGLSALILLLRALKKENLLDKVYMFWFDASLFSGRIASNLLQMQRMNYFVQQHFHTGGFEEEYTFSVEDVKIKAFFSPSFPAKEVIIEHKTFDVGRASAEDKEGQLVRIMASKIENEFGDEFSKEGMAVFIQNRHLAVQVAEFLKEKGFKVFVATAYRQIKLEEIEGGLVIFTSALSRGVDLPFKKIVVFVPSFSVENNLAEILQAIYRIRDGKTDEQTVKKVVFYYRIHFSKDEFDKLRNYEALALSRLVDQLVVAYTNPLVNPGKEFFIPIPNLTPPFYRKTLTDYIEISNFLSQEKGVLLLLRINNGFLKNYSVEYPFVYFFNTSAVVEIELVRYDGKNSVYLPLTPMEINRLSAEIEENPLIPLEKKNRIRAFLEEFENENPQTYIGNIDIALYLPHLVMKHLRFTTSVISKRGYKIELTPLLIKKELIERKFPKIAKEIPEEFKPEDFYPAFLLLKNIDETESKLVPFPTFPLFLLNF